MRELRLGCKIVSTLLKNSLQYPGRLLLDIVAMLSWCGVCLLLYRYVFTLNGGTIKGTTFDVVAWSMFLYFAFSTLRLRSLTKTITQDVISGNVEMLFNKPVSYLVYRFWWQIGEGMLSFLVIAPISVLVMVALLGVPTTMANWFFLATLPIAMLGSALLSLMFYGIFGVIAFWMTDPAPIQWIADKFVMVLAGSYLPVAFFPKIMYVLARFSPFGGTLILSQMPYTTWKTDAWMLLSVQYLWILILGTVLVVMFRIAKQRVSINGG
jgi:ABC-2 type transport system permease protein